MGLAFLGWIFCFWGYLTIRLDITSDARPYLESVHYFSSALMRGEYPLWEPNRLDGVPVEFFNRRIGSYNPVFLLPGLLNKIGFDFYVAYLIYQSVYFFVGMVGFYHLAVILLKDQTWAFLCFLFLLFSSWGTRLFDSYIYLPFIPLIWFFVFLFSFVRDPRRYSIVGTTFCAMLILTTYIPFFTVVIFAIVFSGWAIFYFRDWGARIKEIGTFLKTNRFLAIFCVMALVWSLIPGVRLFRDAARGDIVLNDRQAYDLDPETGQKRLSGTAFEVDFARTTSWGIEEDVLYSASFLDIRHFKLAVVYVPIVALVIISLALWAPMTRLTTCLGFVLFMGFLVSAHRFPVYPFLNQHIFFFKYFRNLHFFLWFLLIPVFILFAVSQIPSLVRWAQKSPLRFLIYCVGVHGMLLWGVLYFNAGWTTAGILVVSCFFWIILTRASSRLSPVLIFGVLLGLVLVPSSEVFYYLQKNSYHLESGKPSDWLPGKGKGYPKPVLNLPVDQSEENLVLVTSEPRQAGPAHYFALADYDFLMKHVDWRVFNFYVQNKLYVVDSVEHMDRTNFDHQRLEDVWQRRGNVAFVSDWQNEDEIFSQPASLARASVVTAGMPEVKIQKYGSHELTLQTRWSRPRFLVFNDSWHPSWRGFIDGAPVRLRRANVTFKGVWIPAGEHVVSFRFGSITDHLLHKFLMLLFYGMFGCFFIFYMKESKDKTLIKS